MLVKRSKEEVAGLRQHAEDAKWLMENYENIRPEYGGQYVAAYAKHVVDHDKDLIRLKKRLKDMPAVIQYVYRQKPHLIL